MTYAEMMLRINMDAMWLLNTVPFFKNWIKIIFDDSSFPSVARFPIGQEVDSNIWVGSIVIFITNYEISDNNRTWW